MTSSANSLVQLLHVFQPLSKLAVLHIAPQFTKCIFMSIRSREDTKQVTLPAVITNILPQCLRVNTDRNPSSVIHTNKTELLYSMKDNGFSASRYNFIISLVISHPIPRFLLAHVIPQTPILLLHASCIQIWNCSSSSFYYYYCLQEFNLALSYCMLSCKERKQFTLWLHPCY